ncbi:type II secretion system GspH family protein [Candidatus Parcubacteria bacterium]|nr:type II secretion system GspH family protein [Candidatus Parcubacteria bacterium]
MKKGFTLIELLVVISIIGLLSSITLATLNAARMKARNAVTIQTIQQYKNAFALAYSDNGEYPDPGSGTFCLGAATFSGNRCWDEFSGGVPVSPTLNTILLRYMPSLPAPSIKKYSLFGSTYSGGTYTCTYDSTGQLCKSVLIIWILEGGAQKCGNAETTLDLGTATWCQKTIE